MSQPLNQLKMEELHIVAATRALYEFEVDVSRSLRCIFKQDLPEHDLDVFYLTKFILEHLHSNTTDGPSVLAHLQLDSQSQPARTFHRQVRACQVLRNWMAHFTGRLSVKEVSYYVGCLNSVRLALQVNENQGHLVA